MRFGFEASSLRRRRISRYSGVKLPAWLRDDEGVEESPREGLLSVADWENKAGLAPRLRLSDVVESRGLMTASLVTLPANAVETVQSSIS